jgi:hypothetical protein
MMLGMKEDYDGYVFSTTPGWQYRTMCEMVYQLVSVGREEERKRERERERGKKPPLPLSQRCGSYSQIHDQSLRPSSNNAKPDAFLFPLPAPFDRGFQKEMV